MGDTYLVYSIYLNLLNQIDVQLYRSKIIVEIQSRMVIIVNTFFTIPLIFYNCNVLNLL